MSTESRAHEKVIRKNVGSDELYEAEARQMMRVEYADIGIVAELLEDRIDFDIG
jgi:hypothetical protein